MLVLGYGLVAAAPAHAFRCGNQIVDKGDRKYDVLSKCGQPDFRDSYAMAYLQGVPVDVVEKWYYNPGPSGLIRILTFSRGRLRSIKTDGYGFEKHGKPHCDPNELEIGMSAYELLGRCGQPVARDEWFEQSGPPALVPGLFHGLVLVKEWTYTFGPTRFRRFVRIVRGRVVAIQQGDWGQ